ncbi:25694_t:CDS:1, partial [Racocetra persica]
ESYSSKQDLYDGLLNTLFPITFVILLNVRNKERSIKNYLLPLLDDILYSMVTWAIPLIVSFTYEDT